MSAPADGVLPDGFFSTTNLPTYVKLPSGWRRPRLPRMDCVIVQAGGTADDLVVAEPRRVRRGDKVAVGAAEDGTEGIFVHGRPGVQRPALPPDRVGVRTSNRCGTPGGRR